MTGAREELEAISSSMLCGFGGEAADGGEVEIVEGSSSSRASVRWR